VKSKTAENHIKITCRGADLLPLEVIEEFQGTLKKRTKRDIEQIIKSILTYGFSFPFFVWAYNGRNYCLDGHGRIQALRELSGQGIALPQFPVAYIDAEDEAEAKQKLLRLNSQYGQMSIDSVMEFTEGLEVDFGDLSLPAGKLKIYQNGETSEDDSVPSGNDVETRTQLGDVYELSSGGAAHRLVCGDSTDPDVVKVATGGAMADLLLTAPPYNVAYTGGTKEALKIKNDSMPNEEFREFLKKAFIAAAENIKPGASFYIWHADSEGFNFRAACFDASLQIRQCLIWNKQSMVLGRQDYQWKHEPCLYGWRDGGAHVWYGDRKQTTVLSFDRPSVSAEHPTMKPVDLFAYQLENSTKSGDIVLDPFLGSGTTIIAAEKLGRICYGVELDPHYCDIIVSRFITWCRENGRQPLVTHNGRLYEEMKPVEPEKNRRHNPVGAIRAGSMKEASA